MRKRGCVSKSGDCGCSDNRLEGLSGGNCGLCRRRSIILRSARPIHGMLCVSCARAIGTLRRTGAKWAEIAAWLGGRPQRPVKMVVTPAKASRVLDNQPLYWQPPKMKQPGS